MSAGRLEEKGWMRIDTDPQVLNWARACLPVALALADDRQLRTRWLRHGGTWFAGVNALGASPRGVVGDGPDLPHDLVGRLRGLDVAWDGFDAGQVSICYPGYPVDDGSESPAAARFRRDRDAAHVDGLHRRGDPPVRYLGERHAFILGLPLTDAGPDASPVSVWEGSHRVMADMLARSLRGTDPQHWQDVDLTEAYGAARRRCFETLRRVEVPASPGEAYVIHRFALHGVAPWRAGNGPRVIAYFRPQATEPWSIYLGGK